MKNLIEICIIMILFNFANAQEIEWVKCYGGSNEDMAWSVVAVDDDACIIAGSSKSNVGDISINNGSSDFCMIKIDINGDILWERSYGINAFERPYAITKANDSGYLIAGYRNSINGEITNSDFLIIKISDTGELIWEKTYGDINFDNARDIIKTNDNCYIVCGISTIPENFYQNSIRVIKINEQGDIIWEKLHLKSACLNFGSSILTDGNGLLLVADDCATNSNFEILKLDSNGNKIWQKNYGGSSSDRPHSIKRLINGNYLIAGASASKDGNISYNYGNFDFWIIEIDPYGNLISENNYGGSGSDMAYDIIETNNNEYFIVGSTMSKDGQVNGYTDKSDIWLNKINKDRKLVWEKCIGDYTGSDQANNILWIKDNIYFIEGYSNSYEGIMSENHGNYDFVIIKLLDGINSTNDVSEVNKSIFYPNPTTGILKFDFEMSSDIYVFDILGKLMKESKYSNYLDLNDLPKGTYIIEVLNNTDVITEKVILQ